jgi:hypothetical protein
VLPADPVLGHPEQEVLARLWRRRQTETGWVYLVGLPPYRDLEDGRVEAAEYRVWVRAPDHVRPVDGVDYDQSPPSTFYRRRRSRSSARSGPRGAPAFGLGPGEGP